MPPANSTDIPIVKHISTGQFEWARTFGGLDYDDVTQAAPDAVGTIYLTGSLRQALHFGATTLEGVNFATVGNCFAERYTCPSATS